MAKKPTNQPKKLRITYIRSAIGYSERHKATIRTLGLRKLHQSVIHEDTPDVRGKLAKVAHLVEYEEVQVEQ
jgi:large subunit ribosomal protein L30